MITSDQIGCAETSTIWMTMPTLAMINASTRAQPWPLLISPTMASMIDANTIQPVHAVLSGGVAARSNLASVLVIGAAPSAEDLPLLGGKLLVGEDPVVAQLGELSQLGDRVDLRGLRRGRGWRRVVVLLLRLLLGLLRGPAVRLAA